jgi:hypothetical protein
VPDHDADAAARLASVRFVRSGAPAAARRRHTAAARLALARRPVYLLFPTTRPPPPHVSPNMGASMSSTVGHPNAHTPL